MTERFITPGVLSSVAPINYGYEACLPGHTYGPAIRSHYLLHYILSGHGHFEAEGVTHRLSAGDIFVIHPGEVTTYCASRDDPWHYAWIGFSASGEFDFLSTPVIHQPQLLSLFQRICSCCEQEYPDAAVFALTFELLSALSKNAGQKAMSPADYAVYTKTHLDNTYMQKISIADIAGTLHIDRRYLTAVFRKFYGVAPQVYLTQLRLSKAKEFLQSGYSVSDTAAMSGFSDLCNFSRLFKAYYGNTPSSFLKQQ